MRGSDAGVGEPAAFFAVAVSVFLGMERGGAAGAAETAAGVDVGPPGGGGVACLNSLSNRIRSRSSPSGTLASSGSKRSAFCARLIHGDACACDELPLGG